MKRILIALACCALLSPVAQQAHAEVGVSIDFFYNNLGNDGSWVDVADYGYCWQPDVAVSDRNWRPYSDGYWAYTDVGWTWVSYEDFGWATYHYGRWARVRDHGWLWVPGREWGPAWVSWRTGGDYVGWAPLPPRRHSGGGEVVYEGRPISGQVDLEFDIGPSYYNFVDVRYIGEPVLRDRIYAPEQNVTYINRTVNVTNITYNNSTVYNYGPDYNNLSAYSTRPIQRLTLERQTGADLQTAAQMGSLTRVQGNQLIVAAPAALQAAPQQAAPKNLRTRIAQPDLETGWSGISDPTAKAELQEKMKKEDPKTVPPPQIAPRNPAAAQVAPATAPKGAAPAAAAAASSQPPAMTPHVDGKWGDKHGRGPSVQPQPAGQLGVSAPPAVTEPVKSVPPVAQPKQHGKDKRQPPQPAPAGTDPGAAPTAAPVAAPPQPRANSRVTQKDPFEPVRADDAATRSKAAGEGHGKKQERPAPPTTVVPPTQQPPAKMAPPVDQPPAAREEGGRGKHNNERVNPLPPQPAKEQQPPPAHERGYGKRGDEAPPVQAPQAVRPPQPAPATMPPRENAAPPAPREARPAPQAAQPPQERGKGDKGEKKKKDEEPAPDQR